MALSGAIAFTAYGERRVTTLNDGWEFKKGDAAAESAWQKVRIPHDWAIYGPFDRDNDLQKVAVEQNGVNARTVIICSSMNGRRKTL